MIVVRTSLPAGWLAILLVLTMPTFAQVDTGVLTGTVSDTTEAPVPQAEVTLLNLGTNYKLKVLTTNAGLYVSPPLPVGTYRIQTAAVGFQTAAKEVELHVAERLAIDFTLTVGALTEKVTVTGIGAVLQTETATLNSRRSEREVQDLPNITRSFVELMRYSPGAVPGQPLTTDVAITATRGNTAVVVNGARLEDNNFLIDGIQNNGGHQGWGVMNYPELEAIEEYRVETSAPDARFGRGGGTLNIGYKSGTNQLHGSLFEFGRNDRLDARNFFALGPKAELRRNQFGGTVGGPIGGKDTRTFFFFSYEGLRLVQGVTSQSTVPTSLMKTGNFSELLTQAQRITIYDPRTTQVSGSTLTRQPFAGNIIPASAFDNAGKNVLNFYPEANRPGLTNNLVIAPRETDKRDQITVKLDRDFSAGSRGFLRYTHGRTDKVSSFSNLLGPVANPFVGTQAPIDQAVASYTQIITATTVNQLRLGFSRHDLEAVSLNGGRNTAQEFGIQNVNVDSLSTGLSNIGVPGYPSIGDRSETPAILAFTYYQLGDNLELIRGKHSIRLGADIVNRRDIVYQGTVRGGFTFGTIYTNNPAAPANTGFGPAELLLGRPSSITVNSLVGTRGLLQTDWGGYVQDDWKVTPRLTVNLGLRYEIAGGYPQYEAYNRLQQFDLKTGQSVPVAQGRFPWRNGVGNDLNNFGPHLGIAYRLSNQTAIRAAYGIYYSEYAVAIGQGLAIQAPFVISTTVTNNQADFNGARPLDQGPLRTADPNATGLNRVGIDPETYRLPYIQQWNMAIQRQLPGGFQTTIAYVGTKGTGNVQRNNLNQAVPGAGAVNLRRRWPQNTAVNIFQMRGNTVYDGLQVSAVRRFANGFHTQFGYTWSHVMDEPFLNGPVPVFDLRRQRGNSDIDIRHFFRGTFGYELPIGRGKPVLNRANAVTNVIAGGWEITGALSLYSGLPFSVTASSNALNIGESTYADRLSSGVLSSDARTIGHWFDTGAFRNPTGLDWGTAGRNILTGPGTKELDFSIFKKFRVSEAKQFQFRAEFYNLTNTPQFNNPAATIGTITAGVISVAGSEATLQRTQRLVQLALKFSF